MSSATLVANRVAHGHGSVPVWAPWLAGWLGATVIGVANGIARRALYEERTGPVAAHYLSTAVLLVLLGGYMALLVRRWPIPTGRMALLIGGVWAVMTVGFEFGLGRLVVGDSWAKLFEQYEFWRGKVWILVPIWIALGPALIREAMGGAAERGQA